MLLNLHKKSWIDGLTLNDYNTHCETNEKTVGEMLELAKNYSKVCIFVDDPQSDKMGMLIHTYLHKPLLKSPTLQNHTLRIVQSFLSLR